MTVIVRREVRDASSARACGMAIALGGFVLVVAEPAESSRWVGYVQDTGMYLSVLSFAVAGGLAAIAGYVTGSQRLAHASELSRSARPVGAALATIWSADLVWVLGGLGLVHLAAHGRTLLAGAEPSPMAWSLGVLSVGSVMMCYLGGVLAGFVLRHPVGAAVIGAVPYGMTLLANGVLSVRPQLQPFARLAAPYVDQSWGPDLVPAHGPIVLLAAYCFLVAGVTSQLVTSSIRSAMSPGRGLPRGWWVFVAPIGLILVTVVLVSTVEASDFSVARPVLRLDQGRSAGASDADV